MNQALKELFVQTIVTPAEAGRKVLSLDISLSQTWQALVLAASLNAIILTMMLTSFPVEATVILVGGAGPIAMFISMLATFSGLSAAFFLAGHFLKGAADFRDILALFTWLQFMRAALFAAALVLGFVSLFLSSLILMLGSLYGLWILVNFLNEAEGFNSLGKSVGVLGMAFLITMMALSVLLQLVGATQ